MFVRPQGLKPNCFLVSAARLEAVPFQSLFFQNLSFQNLFFHNLFLKLLKTSSSAYYAHVTSVPHDNFVR